MFYKIAIIGMGPKGLYAFESLVNELEIHGTPVNLEILLFETSGKFGCGKTYDPDQPTFLLMNYPNRNIDVWGLKGNRCEHGKLSLTKYLIPGRTDGQEKIGDQFSSRATVGRYLRSCFNDLKMQAQKYATVTVKTGTVTKIESNENGYVLAYKRDDFILEKVTIDQIMITTGHDSWKGALQDYQITDVDRKCDIPFVYPVLENFRQITSCETVGIKGLGLTFIDAVLALTEGRDGIFKKTENGTLLYEPSSFEPEKLIAFSRSGMPMVPRAPLEGKEPYTPTFFTYDKIMQDVPIGDRPDFRTNILPLFEKEMELQYYRVLMDNNDFMSPNCQSVGQFDSCIDEFHRHRPEIHRFNCDLLFRPVTMEHPDIELAPMEYYRYILGEAKKGSRASPFMAAALTWGSLSKVFNSVYSFGGLTAESQRCFDSQFRSKLNRISYGPPLVNAEKVLTLMAHGILEICPEKVTKVHSLAAGWRIGNEPENTISFDKLIDARIPANSSIENWSPLLKAMLQNGLIREYINPGTASYRAICPEIDRCGRPVGRDGTVSGQLTLYGSLTEGMTYDNDTLSRARNNFASDWSVRCMEEILRH